MEEAKDWQSESNRSSSDEFARPARRKGAFKFRDLNPLRLLHTNVSYQVLPSSESRNVSPMSLRTMANRWAERGSISGWREALMENRRRCSLPRRLSTKAIVLVLTSIVILALLVGGGIHIHNKSRMNDSPSPPFAWQKYHRLNGVFNGIRTLVPLADHTADNRYARSKPLASLTPTDDQKTRKMPPMEPERYSPYPNYTSHEYLSQHHPVHTCYLDDEETIPAPDVYVYPGVPQHTSEPFYGSYKALGLRDDVCFDRFGRLGPYGYGYNETLGGSGLGAESESTGSEKIFQMTGHVNYTNMDWAAAQKRCYEKNKARFEEDSTSGKERVKRHAYILRAWTGYNWDNHQMLSLRAMINELSLKSGGEYDVHFLLHVKDDSIPIWASQDIYRKTVEENMPQEFWNMTTLWSEKQMEMYYPAPFPGNFVNMAGTEIHGVYRSAHFALQWFSQQHQEYDFFWNWEMDLRFSGHYYEFNNAIGAWGRNQPRKGLWERSKRFYIPQIHGDYQNFTKMVEAELLERDAPKDIFELWRSGPAPIWGPFQDFLHDEDNQLPAPEVNKPPHAYDEDKYEWGVGEDADMLVFNPIFDVTTTNWVFREDVSGYNTSLPPPPRRAAIITVARLSKNLLNTMHEETFRMRHHMFPEMWPPTIALHHGYKAAYVPHPVYFDRDWDLDSMNQVFNYPKDVHDSPFGWGEHNMLGSSFYYNSEFSSALWRRWLGQLENREGGRTQEEEGTGRMCLRSTLFHPVKHEHSPVD